MQWRDTGLIIDVRPYGEADCVVTVLTPVHGRQSGLVHGGRSRRLRGPLQVGNHIQVEWRARLEDHLGRYTVDPVIDRSAAILDHADRLSALSSVCACLMLAVPDRGHIPGLYDLTVAYLDLLSDLNHSWLKEHVLWEVNTLRLLGHGIDTRACAVTGQRGPLLYVSPKTGHAVTEQGAGTYADRLLPLPAFLSESQSTETATPTDLMNGWRLTSHFWHTRIFADLNCAEPQARSRLSAVFDQSL